MPRHVDYALAKRAVLRDLRRGVISRRDVCDAHPELVRAARNVGEKAHHDCPVCDRDRVRFVSYAYGDTLKQANGCAITNAAELDQTKKFRDVARTGRAAIVIDDLASTNPWRPRGVEVRGRAEALEQPALIRIHPERIVSWGIESESLGERHSRAVD